MLLFIEIKGIERRPSNRHGLLSAITDLHLM